MPGGGPAGMYEDRNARRLGFAAQFGPEQTMNAIVVKVMKWTGLYWAGVLPRRDSQDRYFGEREITGLLDECGWDGEGFPEITA